MPDLDDAWIADQQQRFAGALDGFGAGQPLVLAHNDADGLSAGALFARAFEGSRFGPARVRLVGRGEGAWSPAMTAELGAGLRPAGLVVTDLGVQADAILDGAPTVVVDHHVPVSLPTPEVATLISGYGVAPVPTSSLLAYWCAKALVGEDILRDLAWLAALGLVGDLGEKGAARDFPDITTEVRARHSAKALREASALVNAPRRSAGGDAAPALALLLAARGPEDVLSGDHPETAALRAAQEEVKAALDAARRIAPTFAGPAALILMSTPCQIHPLIAQSWTGRLRRQIVIAANTGYREGWVHFALRSATGQNLIAFLKERAPPNLSPDEQFANGHEGATGGSLRPDTWARFLEGLGFKA
ncbi:MAG TPA: phosphoesterase [Beijerinckiaceae bacterium]|jgi:single-stranded-DNA-specific exonuclease